MLSNKKLSLILIWVMSLGLSACTSWPYTQDTLETFASCLTEQNVTMYGTDWCKYCTAQKSSFGNAFENVNYVDCDEDPQACALVGVQSYPTWTFADGSQIAGVQELTVLADKTSCELPEVEVE